MKRIEKEIKSYKTIYVANDGTEFSDEKECRLYDESAQGVITARYSKLILGTTDEFALYGGDDCHSVDIVKPTCERDKDTIMQMVNFTAKVSDSNAYNVMEGYIERAIKEDDVVFVNWNCDHDYCWINGTRNSLKENIDKCVQDFTKDDVEQK